MKYRSLLCVISLILFFSGKAIDFSRVNVAWQYDLSSPLRMKHRVVQQEDFIQLFLEIKVDSIARWQFDLLVQDGYESEDNRSIVPASIDTLRSKNSLLLGIRLSSIPENLLVIKSSDLEKDYYYDIPLKIGSLAYPAIYPVDKEGYPVLDSYINRSGSYWHGNGTYIAIQYPEVFNEADPPMADMKPLAPNLSIDTTFIFSGEPDFRENYFYVVQQDSSASTGVTILKVPPYFPKYRRLNELARAMLYLTTETEKKSVLNSKDLKQTFDSFWMNNFSSRQRASIAIRNYYGVIEEINILFTDFKPGWKTDRGMMYLAYGAPDEVYRTGSLEEWYYDNGAAFEFSIISSFFAPRTYTLRRGKDFEESWYQQIAAIRSGNR